MSLMSCTRNNAGVRPYRRMHYLMGTFLSVEVFHAEESMAKEAIERAFNEVRRVESLLSRFREDSQVYKINRCAYRAPEVIDEELFCLIEQCLIFSEKTQGAFDITVAPLMDLWAQAARLNSAPTETEIARVMSCVGYQNIILDKKNQAVFFKFPLRIDLGAVGKGYALDRAVIILREMGMEKARLDFGGQLYYLDVSQDEDEYAAIRDPLFPERLAVSLVLKNQSLATTANYERSFTIQGRAYGHILNPLDGHFCHSGVLSASAVSSLALESDILSTSAFILGKERCIELLENKDEALLILIGGDGKGVGRVTVLPEHNRFINKPGIGELRVRCDNGSMFFLKKKEGY